MLYEQFERARNAAIASTDHYHDLSVDNPARPDAWAYAMHQTEVARQRLEDWLQADRYAAAEESGRALSPV